MREDIVILSFNRETKVLSISNNNSKSTDVLVIDYFQSSRRLNQTNTEDDVVMIRTLTEFEIIKLIKKLINSLSC